MRRSFLLVAAVVAWCLAAGAVNAAPRTRTRITLAEDGRDVVRTVQQGSDRPYYLRPDLPLYDVTQYGAVGDNKTDCTAAVGKAVSALLEAGPQGGVLYFPAGTFRFASHAATIALIEIWTASPTATWVVAGASSESTILSVDPTVGMPLLYFASAQQGLPLQFNLMQLSVEVLRQSKPLTYSYNLVQTYSTVNSLVRDVSFIGESDFGFESVVSAGNADGLNVTNVTFALQSPSSAAFSVGDSSNVTFAGISFLPTATFQSGVVIVRGQSISINNLEANATIYGPTIGLQNVTGAQVSNIALTSPGSRPPSTQGQPGIWAGLVVDQCSDAIHVQSFEAHALAVGIFLSNNQSAAVWPAKRVAIEQASFLDCAVGISANDNTTLTVSDSTFTGTNEQIAGSGIGTQQSGSSLDLPRNNGFHVNVTGCLFTGLGAGGISVETGVLTIDQCTFRALNMAILYQGRTLPTDPIGETTLTVVNSQFVDVGQYVMFVNLLDLALVQGNNCTLTGPNQGTLDSTFDCTGSHAPAGCVTTGNVGCTFNAEP